MAHVAHDAGETDLETYEAAKRKADVSVARENDSRLARLASASNGKVRALQAWHKLTPDQGRRIYQAFQHLDADASGSITPAELESVLLEMGFTTRFAAELFSAMDFDSSGTVSYREFMMSSVIGNPNSKVNRMLKSAQRKTIEREERELAEQNLAQSLAKQEMEQVEEQLMEMLHVYTPHISEDQVRSLLAQGINPMDVITELESHDRKDEVMQKLLMALAKEKIRRHTSGSKGLNYEALLRCFCFFDMNDDGRISREEFAHAVNCLGCYISEDIVAELFEVFDTNHDGLDYSEFANLVQDRKEGDVWIGSHSGWKFKRVQQKIIGGR